MILPLYGRNGGEDYDNITGQLIAALDQCRRDEAFQPSAKAINEKVRLYARIGQALLAAKEDGAGSFAAIEKIISWVNFRADGLRSGTVGAA